MALPKVLLTGFDAFGASAINPSWEVVCALHRRQISGHRVVAAQLPTVYGKALAQLQALVQQHRPALVICTGLAAGRSGLSLERVAINLADAPLPDNAGAQPIDQAVVADAPVAYFSSLPIKAMHAALARAGIAAELSQSAGTFVCNEVFYGLMHSLATTPGLAHTRGGFIHLPWLPGLGLPCMAQDEMVAGLRIAVRCALA